MYTGLKHATEWSVMQVTLLILYIAVNDKENVTTTTSCFVCLFLDLFQTMVSKKYSIKQMDLPVYECFTFSCWFSSIVGFVIPKEWLGDLSVW